MSLSTRRSPRSWRGREAIRRSRESGRCSSSQAGAGATATRAGQSRGCAASRSAETRCRASARAGETGSSIQRSRRARPERVFISPLARRLAQKGNLEIAVLRGSGPHGRIVRADVEKGDGGRRCPSARRRRAGAGQLPKAQIVALAGNIGFTRNPADAMRRIIAKRMVESKQQVPHFYLTVDCDIDALLKARADLNETLGIKLSVNDFVIRACALALKKFPPLNSSYSDNALLRWNSIDIAGRGGAEDGLITPIVKAADTKRLPQDLGRDARPRHPRPRRQAEARRVPGRHFSISNLGMYGIKHFEAVINPPQGCILAVGIGEERPVVKKGQLAIATVMSARSLRPPGRRRRHRRAMAAGLQEIDRGAGSAAV